MRLSSVFPVSLLLYVSLRSPALYPAGCHIRQPRRQGNQRVSIRFLLAVSVRRNGFQHMIHSSDDPELSVPRSFLQRFSVFRPHLTVPVPPELSVQDMKAP